MKTIAITIDEPTLRALDSLARDEAVGSTNRSRVVRQALVEFIERRERQAREAAEWALWAPRMDQINREAAALVSDQAEP